MDVQPGPPAVFCSTATGRFHSAPSNQPTQIDMGRMDAHPRKRHRFVVGELVQQRVIGLDKARSISPGRAFRAPAINRGGCSV